MSHFPDEVHFDFRLATQELAISKEMPKAADGKTAVITWGVSDGPTKREDLYKAVDELWEAISLQASKEKVNDELQGSVQATGS
jgi:hypothetical protein